MAPPLRTGRRHGVRAGQAVDQAEVGHLNVVADQKQVMRLDVEVLQAELEVDDVEGLGRLPQEAEQLLARHAGLALALVVEQDRLQVAIGQLHDEDQHPVEDLDPFQGEEEGVADALDALDGLAFLGGEAAAGVRVAGDELDGLEQAAGGLALPDLAEAAAAEAFDQARPPTSAWRCSASARTRSVAGIAASTWSALTPASERPRPCPVRSTCSTPAG